MTVAERFEIERVIAETIVADPPEKETPGINRRVLDGVAFLDERVPGWADKIDLDEFEITSVSCCVLGQLYGDYEQGCGTLFGYRSAYSSRPRDLGFLGAYGAGDDAENVDYAVLQESWEAVIRERQCRT